MDLLLKKTKEDQCPFAEQDIQRCPFLKNIDKPTNFQFSSFKFPLPVPGTKGPIFEDGANFDLAFKIFHGQDGVVPLSRRSNLDRDDDHAEAEPGLKFNPLAAKAATISLSAFGSGPFSFGSFQNAWNKAKKNSDSAGKRKRNSESTGKKRHSSEADHKGQHEAVGSEWLQYGNCPIAKSYRAVSHVLPLVAKAMQPPPGVKLRCPQAVVDARAALARTALAKKLRPQPLPAKMFAIALLGMAVNVPLGVWREHTQKFSLSWFVAVHAAVPFVAMLRKAVFMPKTAMALTIGASILGQAIGSRAERIRLKSITECKIAMEKEGASRAREGEIYSLAPANRITGGHRGAGEILYPTQDVGPNSSAAGICF